MSWGEEYVLENCSSDAVIVVHDHGDCRGLICPIHKKTEHSMRDFPQHWRSDRGIMERTCPHGIGHPDPDDPKLANDGEGVHGCDGCCAGAYDEFVKRNDQYEFVSEFIVGEQLAEPLPESINQEAHKIINGARQTSYGSPSESFKTIANLWSEVLGIGVTQEQVILCMIQLKIARAMYGGKRDNYVDIAGYAGLSEMLGDSNEDW